MILHVVLYAPVAYSLQILKFTNIHILDVLIVAGFPLPTCGNEMPRCTKRLLECACRRQIMDVALPRSQDAALILRHDPLFGQNLGLLTCSFSAGLASSRSCICCIRHDVNGQVGGIGLVYNRLKFVLASDNSREITILECGIDDDDSDGSDSVSTPLKL